MKLFKNIKSILLLTTSALILLTSCGTQKVVSNTGTTEEMKTSEIVKNIYRHEFDFNHLTIQSKIKLDIDNSSTTVNAKMYVLNGQKIWVNVSKFGVNGARALITPEGFQAYERIGKTYIDGDFSYFNDLLKVDFIDFQKLQNLMLGKVFLDLKPNEFDSEIQDNQYWLNYKLNNQLAQNPITGKYIQTFKFDAQFQLVEAFLKDPKTQMELTVYYNNWINVGKDQFPKNVKVIVKDRKTQQVDLEYNNFTFEQTETPFEIPSGYKPNEILK